MMRLLESIHGHLGVLAVAALIHPALLLWKGKPLSRNARIALSASVALTAGAFVMGLAIYGDYRIHVKPELFRIDADVGMLFETKEHLAWATVAAALGAGVAGLVAPPKAVQVRRIAGRVFAGAALMCAGVVALGTYIASIHGF